MRVERRAKWWRQFRGKRQPLLPLDDGRGKSRLPWLRRLLKAWARELAARYLLGFFPINNVIKGIDGKDMLKKFGMTNEERKALNMLRLLQEFETENADNVKAVVDAIRVLRDLSRDGIEGRRRGREGVG